MAFVKSCFETKTTFKVWI